MRQIVQNARTGRIEVTDAPAPQARPGYVLARTQASLISAGTERMLGAFAAKNLAAKALARPDLAAKVIQKAKREGPGAAARAVNARLDAPLPLGYSAAGTVIAAGEGLEGQFHPGQIIAMAGAGAANHAEINSVPANLCAPVPEGVAAADACYATLGAVALHAVRNAETGLGDIVAVLGCGLVGQLAAQMLNAAGARVMALEPDAHRRELALAQGAEWAFDPFDAACAQAALAATHGRGADAVIIAAASDTAAPFETAAEIARDRARVVMAGMTGTAFPYAAFMKKELSVVVSRSYGPGRYDDDYEKRGMKYPEGWVRWTETENLAEVLRLTAAGKLNVKVLTTHTFALNDAEAAYALVQKRKQPSLGVVLTYPDTDGAAADKPAPAPFPMHKRAGAHECALGVIGAGAFASSVLLPELKNMPGVTLAALCAPKGADAGAARKKFGFAAAMTDADALINDASVNAVLIAARHDSHADLTAKALAANKPVWTEKPLTLDREGADAVAAARESSTAFFTVGFNRRFAPQALDLRAKLAAAAEPAVISIRVNAGPMPRGHWTQGPEGGGRILGEACHFIDLARFLAGAAIVSVSAEAAGADDGPCDDVSIHLRFASGALASVIYTARGGDALPKERIEAFAGGGAWVIDDFRARGKTDKGHAAMLRAFTAAVLGGPAPAPEAELLETSRAACAVMESLRSGKPETP